MAEVIGQDGHHLLAQIYVDNSPPHLRNIPAIDVMRQVWLQHYHLEEGKINWRDQNNFPPSSIMIASPYDLDVRYSEKRSTTWRGFKVHLTETCEPDSPNLITHVETTQATEQDVTVVGTIHASLKDKGLLPGDHLLDGAYVSGDNLVNSQEDYAVNLIGPVRWDKSWQARDEKAFDQTHFDIDWETQMVTCPNGKQSRYWKPGKGPHGKDTIQVQFDKQDCLACLDRSRCTSSQENPRQLTLPLQAQYLAIEIARKRQKTETFKEEYATRAGVEGTISQSVVAMEMRRTRYRGLGKTHLQHVATAAAINVRRVIDWLWEKPRSETKQSPFARLAPAI